ncbi:radical SAM protein [Bacillus cereus]|nr:radical SAM protein [Bacillus cereus]
MSKHTTPFMQNFKIIKDDESSHLFVTDGSRIYDLDSQLASKMERLHSSNFYDKEKDILEMFINPENPYIDEQPLSPPPLYSISLNVAQICNMSCGYCYADTGKFGGKARMMNLEVAKATVDRLITESSPKSDLVLGYMGGEPLLNRKLIHETTRYAAQVAQKNNRRISFSITTNCTLLTPEDAKLFAEYPFTVAVSIDGDREMNDKLRLMNNGTSSYESILKGLNILNQYGRPNHLSARVTVTPKNQQLLQTLNHLIELKFDEVGFSPVLVSPNPKLEFTKSDFDSFLKQMIVCGEQALQKLLACKPYPFSNLETALHQIHRGTHRPYPCGAGAAYLSTNAEGDLYACHRLIDDSKYAMGNVYEGSDKTAQSNLLALKHVDRANPCKSCWARYLCGGGCYHEVSRRGRIGCDYIRGWLEFCLQAYINLSKKAPDYFNNPARYIEEDVSKASTKSI